MKTESNHVLSEEMALDDFHSKVGNSDYIDSYEYVIKDRRNKVCISDVAELFIEPGPKWFEHLLALRNKIASFFKLKTTVAGKQKEGGMSWEPGVQAGIFEVFGKTETEIILGEDDKHLDVRVSVSLKPNGHHKDEKKITVTTIVKLHNRLGRCYFFVIKPFHRVIVPLLLKRKFKRLGS